MNTGRIEECETRLLKSERWYRVLNRCCSLLAALTLIGVLGIVFSGTPSIQASRLGAECFWGPIFFLIVAGYARARLAHIKSLRYHRSKRECEVDETDSED
jgi:hypothetical protein